MKILRVSLVCVALLLVACKEQQTTSTGGASPEAKVSPSLEAAESQEGEIVQHGDKKTNYISARGKEERDSPGLIQEGDGTKLILDTVVLASPGFVVVQVANTPDQAGTSSVHACRWRGAHRGLGTFA